MRVRCEYCREYYDDNLEGCPHCGAKNNFVHQTNAETPETIEQFKAWFEQHGYTSEKTRFFIGEDYREPKAFGIYKDPDNGDFVVYKNKADGTRAIRYQGIDEAYAVNELFTRFNDEVLNQKNNYVNQKAERIRQGDVGTAPKKKTGCLPLKIILISLAIFIAIPVSIILFADHLEPNSGYYENEGRQYYHINGSGGYNKWYEWDDNTSSWNYVDSDDEGVEDIKDNWIDYSVDQPYNVSNFEDTDYYSDWDSYEDSYYDSSSSSSSYDDDDDDSWGSYDDDDSWDSDWDSSDWDSGSSDWDSDW